MATLTRNTILVTGFDPAVEVAAEVGGDEFLNDVPTATRTFFVANNASGAPIDVTINSQVNCSQGFDHDSAITVPAGEVRWIGPFDKGRWNDVDKKVQITYDGVTSLSVAVYEMP